MATQSPNTRVDYYVYALFRENGQIFYVGKGKGRRWEVHESEARTGVKSHKCNIIRGILSRGLKVIKVKIHEGLTEWVAHAYEVALIKAIGRSIDGLSNDTDGGEGASGHAHTPETRAAIAASKIGKRLSPEHIANVKAGRTGQKRSLEGNARHAATIRGRKLSPEHVAAAAAGRRGTKMTLEGRAKISAKLLGRKNTPKQRANQSAAQLGKKRGPHSAETKTKISAAKIGKSVNLGRKWSPEHLAKRSATRRVNSALHRTAINFSDATHSPTPLLEDFGPQ